MIHEKNSEYYYVGFHIPKIQPILKHIAGAKNLDKPLNSYNERNRARNNLGLLIRPLSS